MKILSIETSPFHELTFNSSGPRGKIRKCTLPFYKAKVDLLPAGVSSIVATSDLQGREIGEENRLVGEVVSEELELLQEFGEIQKVDLVILAGDLYDYPDCRKMGGTGDVTSVWNAFAQISDYVIGVHGNHDTVCDEDLNPNISILDGVVTTYKKHKIGGVSGIIGRVDRNQRKDEAQYEKALIKVTSGNFSLLILHQGPDDLENEQIGEPIIRNCLEKRGAGLVIFGHCFWKIPLISIGKNQVLNVDSKLYIFEE